jgi:hypothetical protein
MAELILSLKAIFGEKTVAWLVVLGFAIPTVWVVYKFFVEGIKGVAQPLFEKKLALYVEITQATSTIATSFDEARIRAATSKFEELYWGELVLVEDGAVESAMVSFRDLIADADTPELKTEMLVARSIDRKALRNASLDLGEACFDSLQPGWLDYIQAPFQRRKKKGYRGKQSSNPKQKE